MLVSLGCQIMLIIGHFYSEACLLSVNYSANYMNIQKEKTIKVPGIHLKVFQCSLRMPKGLESTSNRNILALAVAKWTVAGQGFKITK